MPITAPRYTVSDLDTFPDDGSRYELLDGVLLVTPAPRLVHQIVAARIQASLSVAVMTSGEGHVVGPGVIRLLPGTQLEPDILVFPSRFPPAGEWTDVTEHWLAVEVLSRSSRVYDRDFKRDAYLALGVAEVWLVDTRAKSVAVNRKEVSEIVTDSIRWRVPELGRIVAVNLDEVFAGLP